MKHLLSILLITALLLTTARGQDKSLPGSGAAKEPNTVSEKLFYPDLVNKFYQLNHHQLFWMLPGAGHADLRQQVLNYSDSGYYLGLVEKKYHYRTLQSLREINNTDSLTIISADRLYTDAAIAMCEDVYHGYKMAPWVGFDQLSPKYAGDDDDFILRGLLASAVAYKTWMASLEPADTAYKALRNEIRRQLAKNSRDTVAMLQLSMNYYRWIHHFKFAQLIVVNLPSARLQYFERDSLVLDMKTVVGKTATPTPRFATVCNQAILYPYWYVPRSITFNEYLPQIKRNPSWIDAHNMQVIDGSGKVMDYKKMNWGAYHSGYFPFTLRQSTGCDNALGVIKFNIITPYGVYLHDTWNKTAFLSPLRYFSHGCIRIGDPMGLGNKLLAGKLDTAYLQSCFKEQKPKFIDLDQPVPVFSVYMQAVADTNGMVKYYKDVYKLVH